MQENDRMTMHLQPFRGSCMMLRASVILDRIKEITRIVNSKHCYLRLDALSL